MKKLLLILMVIISIFTLTSAAFTASAEDIAEPPATAENEETQETSPDEPDISDATEDTDSAVVMYICATANSFTGHVWLYFVNNTNHPVTIGYVELQPGGEMSVGSLRNTRKNGGGTYYNGEAMMAAKDGKLDSLKDHTTSLSMNLNEEQIETVSEKIKSINSYEMIFYNCGVFATAVWNSVSNKRIVHIVFPFITILGMRIKGAEKGILKMKDPSEEGGTGIFKQIDGGIIQADERSFNISCVNF